ENPLGKAIKVADAEFRIIGIMEHKGNSLGFDLDDLVMIPETTALDLFDLEAAIADVTDLLRRRHNDQVDFTIISQDDILGTLNAIMATMTMVLLAIP